MSASGINCKFYFIGFRFVYISFNELSLQNIKCHFLCLSRSKHEEDQLYTLIFFWFQLKKNEKKKKYTVLWRTVDLSLTHTHTCRRDFAFKLRFITNLLLHQCIKCTSSTTEERADKDVNFKPSSCPSGAEEKAEMSCMDKDADFETICPLGEVEV